MCGIGLIRLRKPFEYYVDKYKTPKFGLKRLYMLMHKQRNRGQDSAGVATLKMDIPPGKRYISRYRSIKKNPVEDIFEHINKKLEKPIKRFQKGKVDVELFRQDNAYMGEVLLGHARYVTQGANTKEEAHPALRQNNWRSRNLIMAGNFNLTNVEELFEVLVNLGQHPKDKVDTVLVMEKIGHFLDEENQRIFDEYREQYDNQEMTTVIDQNLDMRRVLERACKDFDGGYVMTGIVGNGISFVARDPAGIRPAYYYADEELIVVASEKPAIKSVFDIDFEAIQEVKPAHALIIDREGNYKEERFMDDLPQKSCSFERIYFSRGTDPAIYQERKELGKIICPQILEEINHDLENAIFSYIPNTAETSFLGMMQGLEDYLINMRKNKILSKSYQDQAELEKMLEFTPRVEKLVIKDEKLRTFINKGEGRDELVAHVYNTTYGVICENQDTLVLIDDSIVRGTTLQKSIVALLDKLSPKKLVVVSSAPQIRFPDFYGISMSSMEEFIAFRAVIELLKERDMEELLYEVKAKCLHELEFPSENPENFVKLIYEPFTEDEITQKIAQMARNKAKAEVSVIYQSIENLHKTCPNHQGDWYFTGNYPTQGGMRQVNKAFLDYMEERDKKAESQESLVS